LKNFILNVFKNASICRHFENEVYNQVLNGLIKFPVYLSAGQEYIPATIAEIVKQKKIKPLLFGQHRAHSIYLSFNGNIDKLVKELLGNKNGCTFGMGGSLSIHSKKIGMFGHDGFMGSNACIGTGACFSSKKPTIIFIGDAALEEDYVLASLSWVAKKKLPILFVVEDNNFAVLTKKSDRRDWRALDVAKSFKLNAFDTKDDPVNIFKALNKNIFLKPALINIHTNRLYWHAGAGKDNFKNFDRHFEQKKKLGKIGTKLDDKIEMKIKKIWQNNLEKL
jgi:TPP-dependent pyruvate/acetoin dehydrogenase alpha subunit